MKAKSPDYKRGYEHGSNDMHAAACRRFAEANMWSPMDIAPKTGVSILLWDGKIMGVAAWSEEDKAWIDKELGTFSADGTLGVMQFYDATHWRHLPPTP
jgi:hypothetical protein